MIKVKILPKKLKGSTQTSLTLRVPIALRDDLHFIARKKKVSLNRLCNLILDRAGSLIC